MVWVYYNHEPALFPIINTILSALDESINDLHVLGRVALRLLLPKPHHSGWAVGTWWWTAERRRSRKCHPQLCSASAWAKPLALRSSRVGFISSPKRSHSRQPATKIGICQAIFYPKNCMEKTVDMKSDFKHFLKHIFELQHGPLKSLCMSSLAKFTTKIGHLQVLASPLFTPSFGPRSSVPPVGFHETYLKGHHRHHPAQR